MERATRRRLGLLVPLLLVIAAVLFPGSQASAQDEAITIGSLTLPVAGQGSLQLRALNMPAPGLGAWLIDVVYDPAVVSAVDCTTPQAFAVCNATYTNDSVRVAGVADVGLQGNITLANIAFACNAEERTDLTVTVVRLADVGFADIAASSVNGSITCGNPVSAGDANCNGTVDSIDAALILQFSADILHRLNCQQAADVNANGTVNPVDAALVLQFIAGLLDSL